MKANPNLLLDRKKEHTSRKAVLAAVPGIQIWSLCAYEHPGKVLLVLCDNSFKNAIRSELWKEEPWINRSWQTEGKHEPSRWALLLKFHFKNSRLPLNKFPTSWCHTFDMDFSIAFNLTPEFTCYENKLRRNWNLVLFLIRSIAIGSQFKHFFLSLILQY